MANLKKKRYTFATVSILAISGLLSATTASASQISGIATITIDNSAFAASSINVGGGYPNGWIVNKFWDASYNTTGITASTAGGLTLPTTGNTAMDFPVNTNATTISYPSSGTYGRTEQATTMDANDTSIGQIGLSGAFLLTSVGGSGVLTPYDFNLKKTAGVWNIQTYDNAFSYQNFLNLTDISETVNGNGELLLSGNLKWTGLWANLVGANTNTVVGTFSLAPSAVPVPAAVWLFGSGLMGLLGFARRKTAVAV